MVSAAGCPELIRTQSSPLLLLSALNLWAEVIDWLSQGACLGKASRQLSVDCLNDAWRGVLNVVALTVRLSALIARSSRSVQNSVGSQLREVIHLAVANTQ